MKYQVTSVETGYVVHEGASPDAVWDWLFAHGGTKAYQARVVPADHQSAYDPAALA